MKEFLKPTKSKVIFFLIFITPLLVNFPLKFYLLNQCVDFVKNTWMVVLRVPLYIVAFSSGNLWLVLLVETVIITIVSWFFAALLGLIRGKIIGLLGERYCLFEKIVVLIFLISIVLLGFVLPIAGSSSVKTETETVQSITFEEIDSCCEGTILQEIKVKNDSLFPVEYSPSYKPRVCLYDEESGSKEKITLTAFYKEPSDSRDVSKFKINAGQEESVYFLAWLSSRDFWLDPLEFGLDNPNYDSILILAEDSPDCSQLSEKDIENAKKITINNTYRDDKQCSQFSDKDVQRGCYDYISKKTGDPLLCRDSGSGSCRYYIGVTQKNEFSCYVAHHYSTLGSVAQCYGVIAGCKEDLSLCDKLEKMYPDQKYGENCRTVAENLNKEICTVGWQEYQDEKDLNFKLMLPSDWHLAMSITNFYNENNSKSAEWAMFTKMSNEEEKETLQKIDNKNNKNDIELALENIDDIRGKYFIVKKTDLKFNNVKNNKIPGREWSDFYSFWSPCLYEGKFINLENHTFTEKIDFDSSRKYRMFYSSTGEKNYLMKIAVENENVDDAFINNLFYSNECFITR